MVEKTTQPLKFPIGLKILLLMFFVLLVALGSYFWIATDLIMGDKKASIFDYNQTLVTHLSSEVSKILVSYEESLTTYFKSWVHPVVKNFVQDELLRQEDMIGVFVSERGAGFDADIGNLKQWDMHRSLLSADLANTENIDANRLSEAFAKYAQAHKETLTQLQHLHVINLSPYFNQMVFGIAKFWRTTQGSLFGGIFFKGRQLFEALVSQTEFLSTLVGRDGKYLVHKDPQSVYQQVISPYMKHIEYMNKEKIDAQTIQLQNTSGQEESLVSIVTIPRTQILLTHEIPLEMAYMPIKKLRDRSMYFVMIALLFGILIALVFSKTITAPIQALAEVAIKVKKGIYKISLRRSSASDEIGLLNQSFIEMTDELERRRIAIEKEIFNLKMVHESSKEISVSRVSKNLIPMVLQKTVELLPLDGVTIVYRHREGEVLADHVGEVPLELQNLFSRMPYTEKQTLFDPLDETGIVGVAFLAHFVKQSVGFPFEPHQDRIALLVADGECMGYVFIRKSRKERYITPQDEYMLGAIATSLSITLRNIELVEETADKARLDNELKTAQLVQKTLLPQSVPDFDRVKLTGFYQSATECGGDWWGYFKIGDTLVVMIADATGHGTAAALVTAAARSAVSTIAYYLQGRENEFSPAEFLKIMNHALYETTQGTIFMTFFCAAVHVPTGRLRFSNAGHDFPWIYHGAQVQGGQHSKKYVESLILRGHHIGKQPQATFEEKETQLVAGDKLMLFTDGIPELVNQQGEEYGSKRLLNNFVQHAHLSVVELKDQIIGEVTAFSNKAVLEDDLTLVVLEYT